MKALYFSQDYTVHDHRFLEKLAQTGHEIVFLRFENRPVPRETRPLPDGIKEIDWAGKVSYKRRGWGKVKLFFKFKKVLRKVNPDIVHAGPVHTCGFFTALAGFKPMLLMSWGSDILKEADKNPYARWVTRFTIKRAAMIACDCRAVRDKILKLSPYPKDRIIIFPWGVDLSIFRPGASRLKLREKLGWENNKVIISTRSFEPIYGIDTFLEACRTVIESAPETRVIMLGDGSMEQEVKDFITRHKLENKIHLAGRAGYDMLPDYFNEADLYVSCSTSDGSSVSLLEAMACKLPVVVTDLPANREWVTPGVNGWLAPIGDAEAFSKAMLAAVKADSETGKMSEANLIMAREKADWDKNFSILLKAYEQLYTENNR
jgi:glycosyltransferase involved in cell wall biosynthesis